MAGYNWTQGKSNNAVTAEANGRFPKSKINASLLKEYNISLKVKDVKKLIELNIFTSSEWHHTSSQFNKTYFYDLEYLSDLLKDEDELKRIEEALAGSANNPCTTVAKDDDIIFAEIEITSFEKSRGRWVPIFTKYIAKIEGYNNKTMPAITTTDGDTFRKKDSNIRIVQKIEINEFNTIVEKTKIKREKEEKARVKNALEARKNIFLQEIGKFIEKIEDALILKFKRARSIATIEKIETQIKNTIESIKKEALKHLENIDISDWLLLPKEMRHPAPQHIYDMKISSGMGWGSFEQYMKDKTI